MVIARYFIIFIVFSVAGWIFECIYCTIQEHHWQNRGFLYGPLCPIYGSAVVAGMALFTVLPSGEAGGTTDLPVWMIFLISLLVSAVLEFTTSWVLEKCFHARWWDYSNMPFNVQGRICLPASCGFGVAGVVIVKWIFPVLNALSFHDTPMLNELLALLLAFLLGVDTALTVDSLMRLTRRLDEAEEHFNRKMEEGVQTMQQGPEAVGRAMSATAKDAAETAAIAAMVAADHTRDRLDTAKEKAETTGRVPLPRGKLHLPEDQKLSTGKLHLQKQRDLPRLKKRPGEWELPEHLRNLPDQMSHIDRYHLRSIRSYRPKQKGRPETEARLRKFFNETQERAGRPRNKKKKK